MSPKKSFVLRMDERTFKALEKWAGDEFRSTNGQIEWILHQALKKAGRYKEKEPLEKPEQERSDPAG